MQAVWDQNEDRLAPAGGGAACCLDQKCDGRGLIKHPQATTLIAVAAISPQREEITGTHI